jgi:hypothetical protein
MRFRGALRATLHTTRNPLAPHASTALRPRPARPAPGRRAVAPARCPPRFRALEERSRPPIDIDGRRGIGPADRPPADSKLVIACGPTVRNVVGRIGESTGVLFRADAETWSLLNGLA